MTARAEAVLDPEAIACTIRTWHGETRAGLHAATGGTGDLACSADMMLEALAACAGVTLRTVATAMGIALRTARVTAKAEWNATGTLGLDRTARVGLTNVTLRFTLDTDAEPKAVTRLVETTERYCVILQTLRNPPALSVEVDEMMAPRLKSEG